MNGVESALGESSDLRLEVSDDVGSEGGFSTILGDWKSLSDSGDITCFQSVHWVQVWLECYRPKVSVLRVSQDSELVGMCLLLKGQGRTKLGVPVSSLYFQQTGSAELDQIWVEYNGVLSKKGKERSVHEAVCEYLSVDNTDWDELNLGTARESYIDMIQSSLSLTPLVYSKTLSYGVNLKTLREDGVVYLDSISRNTRYQIRRSIKLYQAEGEKLEIIRASNSKQAENFLMEAGELHMKRWGKESGFYNEHFINFHTKLIANSFDEGFVDVLKVVCGERVLGYIYNMCCNGVVYFYLSGLSDDGNTKIKPGLTAHALAIEYYKERGLNYYDFMGGGGQYKESLGTAHETLVYASLRKDKLKFRIEELLRVIKQGVKERFLS